MNHIGTHDTARALTKLIYDDIEHKPRHIQAEYRLSEEGYQKAKQLLKAASVIQYTLPGFPSLYYGDEAGVQGGGDPFNRTFYPWGNEDEDILSWYRHLGKIRSSLSCLKDGEFRPYSAMLSCIAYIRSNEKEKILVIVNRNFHTREYNLPDEFKGGEELLTASSVESSVTIPAYSAAIVRVEI
jgi:glycosidase